MLASIPEDMSNNEEGVGRKPVVNKRKKKCSAPKLEEMSDAERTGRKISSNVVVASKEKSSKNLKKKNKEPKAVIAVSPEEKEGDVAENHSDVVDNAASGHEFANDAEGVGGNVVEISPVIVKNGASVNEVVDEEIVEEAAEGNISEISDGVAEIQLSEGIVEVPSGVAENPVSGDQPVEGNIKEEATRGNVVQTSLPIAFKEASSSKKEKTDSDADTPSLPSSRVDILPSGVIPEQAVATTSCSSSEIQAPTTVQASSSEVTTTVAASSGKCLHGQTKLVDYFPKKKKFNQKPNTKRASISEDSDSAISLQTSSDAQVSRTSEDKTGSNSVTVTLIKEQQTSEATAQFEASNALMNNSSGTSSLEKSSFHQKRVKERELERSRMETEEPSEFTAKEFLAERIKIFQVGTRKMRELRPVFPFVEDFAVVFDIVTGEVRYSSSADGVQLRTITDVDNLPRDVPIMGPYERLISIHRYRCEVEDIASESHYQCMRNGDSIAGEDCTKEASRTLSALDHEIRIVEQITANLKKRAKDPTIATISDMMKQRCKDHEKDSVIGEPARSEASLPSSCETFVEDVETSSETESEKYQRELRFQRRDAPVCDPVDHRHPASDEEEDTRHLLHPVTQARFKQYARDRPVAQAAVRPDDDAEDRPVTQASARSDYVADDRPVKQASARSDDDGKHREVLRSAQDSACSSKLFESETSSMTEALLACPSPYVPSSKVVVSESASDAPGRDRDELLSSSEFTDGDENFANRCKDVIQGG